jgi:predicted dehydrogenase
MTGGISMKPVRWGVLGVATHFILRVLMPLLKSGEVEVYGIASRSGDRAKRAAAQWGIPRSYGSYEELLADKDIEAVYVPLPNHLHAEWIKKCADAGKHVLCEKPLGLNSREVSESVAYAQKAGVLLMEAFMYRFHPQWRRALELVRIGEIGTVRAVHTYFVYDLKDPSNIRNKLDMGGGALMDIGCYAVSVPRWLFGRQPERVLGVIERDPQFKTDIFSSAILDFGEGRSLFTVGTQTFPYQRVDIHGTGGHISVHVPFNMYPDVPPRVTVITSVGRRELELPAADQYALEFESFSRAIRGAPERDEEGEAFRPWAGLPGPTPTQDAIENQRVLDALFRSAESGRWEEP